MESCRGSEIKAGGKYKLIIRATVKIDWRHSTFHISQIQMFYWKLFCQHLCVCLAFVPILVCSSELPGGLVQPAQVLYELCFIMTGWEATDLYLYTRVGFREKQRKKGAKGSAKIPRPSKRLQKAKKQKINVQKGNLGCVFYFSFPRIYYDGIGWKYQG